MNDFHRPRTPDAPRRYPDDLDRLLRAFFRSEMPDPWPAPPVVSETPRARFAERPRRRFFQSSRMALAAAVAFFLVGYLALSWAFPQNPGQSTLAPGGPSFGQDRKLHQRRGSMLPPAGRVAPAQPVEIPPEVVPIPNGKAEISGRIVGPRRTIHLHVKQLR